MSAEIKSHLVELLTRALAKVAPQQARLSDSLERPKQARHGDFSCPAAMQLRAAAQRNPREIALELVAALPPSDWLDRAEVAGSGFINLRVKPAARQHVVRTILDEGRLMGALLAAESAWCGGVRFREPDGPCTLGTAGRQRSGMPSVRCSSPRDGA